MGLTQLINEARQAISVERVYGPAMERAGITVIPAAAVHGGAGGGENEGPERKWESLGGGFGLAGRPVGAYVIKDGDVRWRPAIDVNRLMLVVGVVALGAILTGRRIALACLKTHRARSREGIGR